jgi:hypothetical protein
MKLKNVAIYAVICSICFAGGWGSKHYLVKQELEKLVVMNTRTIHSYAFNSMTQTYLADYMIETLNALNNKPVKELPERFTIPKEWDKIERDSGTDVEEVPVTIEQAIKDSREFDQMFRNFAVSSLMQADTMKNILKKIQERKDNGNREL